MVHQSKVTIFVEMIQQFEKYAFQVHHSDNERTLECMQLVLLLFLVIFSIELLKIISDLLDDDKGNCSNHSMALK